MKKLVLAGAGVAGLAVAVGAFFLAADSGSSGGPRAANLQPLQFHIDWWESPEYIGFFIAKMLGYYADEGLDVTIKPGGGSAAAARALTEGTVALGTANAHSIVREAWEHTSGGNAEAPQTPRIVALVFPRNPSVVVTRSNVKASGVEDLAGLKIGYPSPSAESYREFLELLKLYPGLESRVRLEPFFLQATSELKSGAIDGLLSYLMDAPADLEAEQFGFNLVRLGDLGIDVGGQCVAVAGDARIEPAVLDAFIRASVRGWEFVRSNPENAAKLFSGQYAEYDLQKTRIIIRHCLSVMPAEEGGAAAYTDPATIRRSVERSVDLLQAGGEPPPFRDALISSLAAP